MGKMQVESCYSCIMADKDRLTAFSNNFIFWLFTLGVGVVSAGLSAGAAYAQGLPLYWIIILGWAAASLFAFAAYFTTLALIAYAKNKREAQGKWLHDLAKQHRDEIGRYVLVLESKVQINSSSATPYAKFTIDCYNISVHTISIDPKFSGSISYGGRRLKEPVEVINTYPLDNLPHAHRTYLEFNQWLGKDELEFIMNDANKNSFDLSKLIFTIVGSKSEVGIMPQPLRYGLHSQVRLDR